MRKSSICKMLFVLVLMGIVVSGCKKQEEKPQRKPRPPRNADVWQGSKSETKENMSFEDMMAKFKSVSDEKMSDLKKNNVAKRGASTPRRGGNSRG